MGVIPTLITPSVLSQTSNPSSDAERLLNLCRKELDNPSVSIAIQTCRNAQKIYQKQNDRPREVRSTVNLGLAYINANQTENAIASLQADLTLANQLGEKRVAAIAASNLGVIYKDQTHYPQARRLLQTAIQLFSEIEDRLGVAQFTNVLGHIEKNLGNYPAAIAHYQTSAKTAQQINRPLDQAIAPRQFSQCLQSNWRLSQSD